MTDNQTQPIRSVETLLAHSLAIESEAAERYGELADQMETHNNPEVAELFRKLEAIEGLHIDHVKKLSGEHELPLIPPRQYRWGSGDTPEVAEQEQAHYLMTPYHALSMALEGEHRAVAFFTEIASSASQKDVRQMAQKLAEEEREHVVLLQQWLSRYPAPTEGWDDDLDPPSSHE